MAFEFPWPITQRRMAGMVFGRRDHPVRAYHAVPAEDRLRVLRLQTVARPSGGASQRRAARWRASISASASRASCSPSHCSTWRSASPGCSPPSAASCRCCRIAATPSYNWISLVIELVLAAPAAGVLARLCAMMRQGLFAAATKLSETMRDSVLRSTKACARRQSTFGRGAHQSACIWSTKINKVKDLARVPCSRHKSCGLSGERSDGPWPSPVLPSPVSQSVMRVRFSISRSRPRPSARWNPTSTRFEALLNSSDDLTRLIRSPVFSAEEQSKAIGAVLAAADIKGLAGNFLRVVANNRRCSRCPPSSRRSARSPPRRAAKPPPRSPRRMRFAGARG